MTIHAKLALYESAVTDPRSGSFRMVGLENGVVQQIGRFFAGEPLPDFRIENRTYDPTTPAVGTIWLRTDL